MSNENVLKESVKFIGKLSTMGKKKLVIYIPQENHELLLSKFKGKHLKVTIEEAL